jgi:hypothetical protein
MRTPLENGCLTFPSFAFSYVYSFLAVFYPIKNLLLGFEERHYLFPVIHIDVYENKFEGTCLDGFFFCLFFSERL